MMRNKQRLLIMFLLIVTLFLYIVNNSHGLLYNHVIVLEDEISFVANLREFVFLEKLMSVLDTNILLILILFFAYAGQWAAEIKRKDINNRKENKEKRQF